ncbi:hypothetical protein IQ266_03810 [filamentous cyanobacterium LEGE 11480]|uniref:Uncharacterized protein n=1 Tax=Romeriopsis navalis LEGE 11480 TaxID=2777977 RepID=A0A928VLM0_9CYAN|nr:SGNH/GDSL hydrolase family protein [Romeriopsis navalis]MBE9028886.1 hypothetical protein [Romeriopsis navalis LEGE 11480]
MSPLSGSVVTSARPVALPENVSGLGQLLNSLIGVDRAVVEVLLPALGDPLALTPVLAQLGSSLPPPVSAQLLAVYDDLLSQLPELLLDVSDIILRLPALDLRNPLTIDPDAAGQPFSQLVAFGDSLTDIGNVSGQLAALGVDFPPVPYSPGRLSNGPLWIEYVAEDLTATNQLVNPTPLNNAVLGARAGRNNVATLSVADALGGDVPPLLVPLFDQLPGVLEQVDLFADQVGVADPNALYLIWGGSNDFLTLPTEPIAAVTAVIDAVESIEQAIVTLAELGAKRIIVPNLANLGRTPIAIQQDLIPQATAFSTGFNLLLQGTLGTLEPDLDVDIIQVDVFSLVEAIAQQPSEFGFTNITDPLINILATGERVNPAEFAFMDGFHPTTAIHRLIADVVDRSLAAPTPGLVLPTTLNLAGQLVAESGFPASLVSLLEPVLDGLVATVDPPLIQPLPLPMDVPPDQFGIGEPATLQVGERPAPLFGNDGHDTLIGGAANHRIFGSDAAEKMIGGIGNDQIYANGGLDYIDSGSGFDEIWLGGAGKATVVLTVGDGYDTIVNYQAGSTRLKFTNPASLVFADSALGLMISQDDDLLAVVAHRTVADFGIPSAVFR